MIKLIKQINLEKHSPLYFLLAHSDVTSKGKVEKSLEQHAACAEWLTIYRSREVKQSFFTSIFSTLIALKEAVVLVMSKRPQLILCNGPGKSSSQSICLKQFVDFFSCFV